MQNWASRLRRLRGLGRDEIATRAQQFVRARVDWLQYRAGRDFAGNNLQLDVQPSGRFFFAPGEVRGLCALLQRTLPASAADIVFRANKSCKHRFDLLGYSNLNYGVNIDWHLDIVHAKRAPRQPWFDIMYLDFEQVGDSKITWELNRHQHFPVLAKAYWLTGNEQFVQEIFSQWEHWTGENPYPVGINWASSLEVAFRSLSWIWTFFLLQDCPLFTDELRRQWMRMLNLSGHHIENFLSTYFSPNTHLLGEALALFFLGTLFPLPLGDRWRDRGWNILLEESARQVRPDGFYFEQSTFYHVYALDMFLHARILAGLNQIVIPDEFEQSLQRMLDALFALSRAGVPPMFGDDDGGRLFDPRRIRAEHMLDPFATGSVLYGRGDFKSLVGSPTEEMIWLLGPKSLESFELPVNTRPSLDSMALANGGFYMMADVQSQQQLVVDAGPLGAGSGGHGHADALSVWLVRNGRSLLRDSGTFEYVGENNERSRLRSTHAHNTLRLDRREQATDAGPFSWESLPNIKVRRWFAGQQFDLLEAEHDGYSQSVSPVTHRRWVFHKKDSFWLVRDVAEGSGRHEVELAWHLGAGLSQSSASVDVFAGAGDALAIRTVEGHGWSRELGYENWSPAYGCAEPAPVVRFAATRELPAEFVTILIASSEVGDGRTTENRGQFVGTGDAGAKVCSSYRYSLRDESHQFVFGGQAGPWTQDSWSSDADFLYSHHDGSGRLCSLLLSRGTYADFDGVRLVSCDQAVSYAEVSRVNEHWNLFCLEGRGVRLEPALDGQPGVIKI